MRRLFGADSLRSCSRRVVGVFGPEFWTIHAQNPQAEAAGSAGGHGLGLELLDQVLDPGGGPVGPASTLLVALHEVELLDPYGVAPGLDPGDGRPRVGAGEHDPGCHPVTF